MLCPCHLLKTPDYLFHIILHLVKKVILHKIKIANTFVGKLAYQKRNTISYYTKRLLPMSFWISLQKKKKRKESKSAIMFSITIAAVSSYWMKGPQTSTGTNQLSQTFCTLSHLFRSFFFTGLSKSSAQDKINAVRAHFLLAVTSLATSRALCPWRRCFKKKELTTFSV